MTDAARFTLRVKEIPDTDPDQDPPAGTYWTLDEGPEDDCHWSGPHANVDAAKASALEAITAGYVTAANLMLTGE